MAFCSKCGAKVSDKAVICVQCGNSLAPKVPQVVTQSLEDTPLKYILPIGCSIWAVIASYLGLLSVLGIFSPFAIVTGVIAILDIKKHPERRGLVRAWFGIGMGSLFLLFWLFAMLVSVANA